MNAADRTSPDWLYAHEKRQERQQWEQEKATSAEGEQELRVLYEQQRQAALQDFLASAVGHQKYEQAFAPLLAFYQVTEPHRSREAAEEATIARLERFDVHFPDYAVWALTKQTNTAVF